MVQEIKLTRTLQWQKQNQKEKPILHHQQSLREPTQNSLQTLDSIVRIWCQYKTVHLEFETIDASPLPRAINDNKSLNTCSAFGSFKF